VERESVAPGNSCEHVAAEAGLGLRAVEADRADRGVGAQERAERVHDERLVVDVRVEAARARARVQHVPERDPRGEQPLQPDVVRRGRVDPEQAPDDPPE